jgi:hypothetical protein
MFVMFPTIVPPGPAEMTQIANKDRIFGNVLVRRVFQSTGPGCSIAAESDEAMSIFFTKAGFSDLQIVNRRNA